MTTQRSLEADHGADAVYVNLTDRPIKEREQVADRIVVDNDNAGRIVGVEILDASKRTDDPEVLKTYLRFCNRVSTRSP